MSELYSHSRLKCFENCPKQFHFKYVLELPQETEGIEAFVGKRVHEVLERLYNFVGEGNVPSLPQVKSRYEQSFDAEYDPDRVRIVREGMTVSFYRELGARCLDIYYRRNYPFDKDQTLGVEEHVEFDLDPSAPGQYRIQGFIDRVSRASDGALEIHDYKTGNYVPNQKALDADRQLALYQIGIGNRFGSAEEVRLVWHYVARGLVRQSVRTPEQLAELRTATMGVIDQIRVETAYEPRKIPLCDWCEFKNVCPAWNPHALPPRRTNRTKQPRSRPTLPSTAPEQLSLL